MKLKNQTIRVQLVTLMVTTLGLLVCVAILGYWGLQTIGQIASHFKEVSAPRQAISTELWAAAGSVDTDLSFLSFLELYGTEVAERRMPARRVVEAFDVVEHV